MPATHIGLLELYGGEHQPTLTFYKDGATIMQTSYIVPFAESTSIGTTGEHRTVKNAAGDVVARRTTGHGLQCTLQLRPKGATYDEVRNSATLPAVGWTAAISGMPVIKMGVFLDGWNVAQGSTAFNEGVTDGSTMWHVSSVTQLSGDSLTPQMFSVNMERDSTLVGNVVVAD